MKRYNHQHEYTSEMRDKASAFEIRGGDYFDPKDIPHFVLKLYRILEEDRYISYIRWSDSGDSFIIPDGPLLAAVVLPNFYKSSTFTSFVRQLNIYGFRRITDARKAKNPPSQLTSAFAHPYFSRGKVSKLHLIKRKVKRSQRSKSRDTSESSNASASTSTSVDSMPSGVNGRLECPSSDAESLNDNDHPESCNKCNSLREEVQLLRHLLRRYQHMDVSGVQEPLPYTLPVGYEGTMDCVRSAEFPIYSEANTLKLPNWSAEFPIPENTGYDVTPTFFCSENPVHNYDVSITSTHWSSPTNELGYVDQLPSLSVSSGWDTENHEAKQFNIQLSC
ncbi:winged helix DNA-binding domain-containing protein [Basidiobolus meristosporus CBS 931.73]|uniref:Winged helix DNA-binding domain-containing protein n=1 Tax=Basidiobolus meristosporus CBS 931.73 TaxID=1314790 RepID=A0A1Y1YQV4_9FUNG|nr:winged helix DNA-binding domain-containing protein [Basidiobolus meristosporus CBS 931.73]|eukprot:ORY00418.1 winged helix DNA-binding domain-containing protein [Basidiobolus meristosporus CBS 931.73]